MFAGDRDDYNIAAWVHGGNCALYLRDGARTTRAAELMGNFDRGGA